MNAIELNEIISMPMAELFSAANKVREEHIVDRIELCGIVNAKSGSCSENCKFCAQSAHHGANIETYALKDVDKIISEAEAAKQNGAGRFGIVTSGNKLTGEEIGIIAEAVRRIIKEVGISVCASLGALDEASFLTLREAGLTRYHHNIETSERFYPNIVTTHDYTERTKTVKAAKALGLEVCSGGIIGMGETWQDRMDMANLLKELDVDSVPLNFLVPIKGTPLENIQLISSEEAIRTIALFRFILKDKTIKIAAGRESALRDHQESLYMAGANGMLIGGYLTIAGRPVEDDHALIEEVRKLWNGQ